MKAILGLLGAGLLVTTLAVAQDMPSSSNTDTSKQTQQTHQTSSGVIRGCLSGSAGNYTITDQNGMQYTINGPDNQLQSSVGHEVEVSTSQDQASQTSTEGDRTTASATNSVQVSNLHDLGSSCKPANPMSSSPAHGDDEDKGSSPQRAPDAATQPQTMAMLQEQQGVGTAPQQTTPPVTSQTPATPQQNANSAQQATPPASTSATPSSTTTTTGSSQPDQTAPAAQQGQMNTNPPAGAAGNQGAATSTASPSAAPSSAQQPNANDQNKPLYERPATDIPWANHSGDSSGSTTPPPQ